MFKVSESQKKVLIMWGVLAVVIFALVIFLAFTIRKNNSKSGEEKLTGENSNMLIDRNRYYTVRGALTKYYSFLNMADYKSALIILDKDYQNEMELTEDNLKEKLDLSDVQLAYQTYRMCLKNVKKGQYTYLVEGKEISANKGTFIKDNYYEITLDGTKSIFSLFPVTKEDFERDCYEQS